MGTYRVTTLDVIWHTFQKKVYKELKDILGVSEVDTSTKVFFEQWTAAAKRIYKKMSQNDQERVQAEVKNWKSWPSSYGATPVSYVSRRFMPLLLGLLKKQLAKGSNNGPKIGEGRWECIS